MKVSRGRELIIVKIISQNIKKQEKSFKMDAIEYKKQNFFNIYNLTLKSGSLFEDPEFPVEEKCLFVSGQKLTGIEWKRPKVK